MCERTAGGDNFLSQKDLAQQLYWVSQFHFLFYPQNRKMREGVSRKEGRTDGRKDRRMEGRMDGRTEGRMDGWMEERMEGWKKG